MSMPTLLKLTEYRPDQPFTVLIPPYTVLLKDGETTATIYPLHSADQLPPGLLAFLADEFNMEVERGDTFPFFETLDIEEFKQFWFASFAAVMVLGEDSQLDHQRQWEKECLGTFFIRPNFPGRSSHISTGGFLVNAGIRGKGIGRTLVECYLDWAPKLGYTSSMFNLVFESNVGARKIFEALNFKRIGKIKSAGILKEHESAVDAYIYGKELVQAVEPNHATYRFDKIKYYLETGRYPPLIDRQEKSRLRSSAAHYKLVDGKLLLNGREVISDPVRQLEICTEYHRVTHGGINKTTSSITERYHWTRIKDTVAQAIRNCHDCRDVSKNVKRKKESPPLSDKPHATIHATGSTESLSMHHHHHDSNGSSHGSSSHQQQQQQQDYDSLVNGDHRSHENLLQAELQGLEIPPGILAAVANVQRLQQHNDQHQDSYDTDVRGRYGQPQDQHQHQHQHAQQQSQQQQSQQSQQSQRTPHTSSHTPQSAQAQQQHSQQRVREYSQSSSSAPYLQQHHTGHSQSLHSLHQHHGLQDNGDIPVDPEVSAFDSQDQTGSEIEIARALINANTDGSGQDAEGDEDLFR